MAGRLQYCLPGGSHGSRSVRDSSNQPDVNTPYSVRSRLIAALADKEATKTELPRQFGHHTVRLEGFVYVKFVMFFLVADHGDCPTRLKL